LLHGNVSFLMSCQIWSPLVLVLVQNNLLFVINLILSYYNILCQKKKSYYNLLIRWLDYYQAVLFNSYLNIKYKHWNVYF
jgi:hypothetical protein